MILNLANITKTHSMKQKPKEKPEVQGSIKRVRPKIVRYCRFCYSTAGRMQNTSPNNGSSEPRAPCHVFICPRMILGDQERHLQEMAPLQQLSTSLSQLVVQLPITTQPSLPAHPTVTWADKYASDLAQCWGFLLQCRLCFVAQERISDATKVNIVLRQTT